MVFNTALVLNVVFSLVVLIAVYKLFGFFQSLVSKKKNLWYRSLVVRNNEILNVDNIELMFRSVLFYAKWIVLFFLLYLAVPLIFAEVPETREWSLNLLDLVKETFVNIGISWVNYIPNLITIAVIAFVARKLLQATKFFFEKIQRGDIVFEGFYSEWADTTYSLIKFLIVAFSFVAVYPYLPGSGSKAFEGVSVFLGLLISLGSSSAISNIVAGVVLTYMRPFKVGDIVQIDSHKGQIIEKGITVTKLLTFKNETITIPNTKILGGDILNFSIKADKKDLIVNTTVTIGYDTPWTLVHEMLKKAAHQSSLINQDKEPFVLQTALNDYHISYELNAYTEHAAKLPRVYSELHQNIQEVFAKNKVEIMSPGFHVVRQGPTNTTPLL